MREEAQRRRMGERIGALEARAADHRIDAMMAHIGEYAAPQQLDRALAAILLEHAGASELQKAQARMTREQRREIIFAGRIEAALLLRDIAAQQAIGADHLRLHLAEAVARGVIDDDEMIAEFVEAIGVAARDRGLGVGDRAALAEEDFEAQALRLADFLLAGSEPHLERSEPRERSVERAVVLFRLQQRKSASDDLAAGVGVDRPHLLFRPRSTRARLGEAPLVEALEHERAKLL